MTNAFFFKLCQFSERLESTPSPPYDILPPLGYAGDTQQEQEATQQSGQDRLHGTGS
jgi:hypothetical protein